MGELKSFARGEDREIKAFLRDIATRESPTHVGHI